MMESTPENELEKLTRVQEVYRTKAFRLVIHIAFIFGVPAAIAFFGGKVLDARFGTGKILLLVSLAAAFVFSWIIVIIQYRALDRELRAIDEKVKKEKHRRAETGLLKAIERE